MRRRSSSSDRLYQNHLKQIDTTEAKERLGKGLGSKFFGLNSVMEAIGGHAYDFVLPDSPPAL